MKKILAVLLFIGFGVRAQTYSLEAYQKTYEQKQQALLVQYGTDLDTALLELKKKGDFDNYLLLEAEKKRFNEAKTVPEVSEAKAPYRATTVTYGQALVLLQEQYIKALEEHIKKMMISNRIEDAKTAKTVKDDVAAGLTVLKAKLPTSVSTPVTGTEAEPEKPATLSLFSALSKDLVLYYSFDKNTANSVSDTSRNRNDGRLLGAKCVKEGKVGGACAFNGSSERILINHHASLDMGSGPRTLGVWIKCHGSTDYYQSIFTKGSNPGYALRLASYPDRAIEYFKSGGDNYSMFTSSYTIADTDWHHLVVVDQGNGRVEFYKDGIFLEAMTRQNQNSDTKEKVAVGGLANVGHQQWFNGQMDELFIFNRALTKTEIQQIYDTQNKKP